MLLLFIYLSCKAQSHKDSVYVKNQVFEVVYSEVLEQPKWLVYHSTNRPTKVNRGSMDFYTEEKIHTSNKDDYRSNIYDKGHLAPAATFSDNIDNLKQTFSYLNCALQNQYLNRGEWRMLEEQERKWDDNENLTIKIENIFTSSSQRLQTNATIPDAMVKHIYFNKSKKWICFYFLNEKPSKSWKDHEVKHSH